MTPDDPLIGDQDFVEDDTVAEDDLVVDETGMLAEDTTAQEKATEVVDVSPEHASQLSEAKNNAKTSIDKLVNLTELEKESYLSNIESSETLSDISLIVEQALAADQIRLNNMKSDVKKVLESLEFINEDEKTKFLNQVNEAVSVELLNQVLLEAKALNKEAEQLYKLEQTKEASLSIINNLNYLTEEVKQSFKEQVNKANTLEEVKSIEEQAVQSDDEAERNAVQNPENIVSSVFKAFRTRVRNAFANTWKFFRRIGAVLIP